MKVHVLDPYQSHAMQRMSAPFTQLSSLHDVTFGAEPQEADITLHLPWHTVLQSQTGGKHIAIYTHCNPQDSGALLEVCEKADLITCMSFRGRQELIELGADPKKLWVVYAAADGFRFRRRVIGIVGNVQPNGRKRESLLIDMAWKYDLSPFEFVFIGHGWDETVSKLTSLGVSAVTSKSDEGDLQKYYQLFDALLVTGYSEGGSLPILEAMSVGAPIISPDFGYAADLIDFHYDTPEDLSRIFDDMIKQPLINYGLAKSWTWGDYASEYAMIISRLVGGSAEIYPAKAADRYRQLLDIISWVKPKNILEVGTWNGNRAIQMIQEAAKFHNISDINYQGFDLFDDQTGALYRSELSKVAIPMNVAQKRIEATGANVELIRGNTNKTLWHNPIVKPDFTFIDGGHSEKTIQNDWDALKGFGAVVIFDDYYHEGKPDGMGCNAVIDGITNKKITYLPNKTAADDGRVIGMVMVENA